MVKAKIMWQDFLATHSEITQDMDTLSFGAVADTIANLVLKGIKTATSFAYELYETEAPLLQGDFLDSQDKVVCIIEIKKVSLVPFYQVSAQHAYKEGEDDRSLLWW